MLSKLNHKNVYLTIKVEASLDFISNQCQFIQNQNFNDFK